MTETLTDEFFGLFWSEMVPDKMWDISDDECQDWYNNKGLQSVRKKCFNVLKDWVHSHGGMIKKEYFVSSRGDMGGYPEYTLGGLVYHEGDKIPDEVYMKQFPVISSYSDYMKFFAFFMEPPFPIILYYLSDGTKYLFNSWTDGDLGRDPIEGWKNRQEDAIRIGYYGVEYSKLEFMNDFPVPMAPYIKEFSE